MKPIDQSLKVLVVGATGGTGRATVEALLRAGHRVTAFARSATRLAEGLAAEGLRALDGDATNPDEVDRAVQGQDAVVVTLGIRENPLRVRLLGPARTPMDVRSTGTRNVVAAMARHGVSRLAVQSSYGVGETRERLGLADRLLFGLLLKPQIADTEVQEQVVRSSELDWLIAQPVHLTDADEDALPFTSLTGDTRRMSLSRKRVARFLADSLSRPELSQASVALSG